MTKELPKAYEPQEYEDEIYKKWEESGYFNPDNLDLPKDAKSYTIILPPPNITDKLHLGHSSMLAIEDLLIRFHRMRGFRTLWVPGTDHAAIATQNVVEKRLLKEEGKTRHDVGREKLLEKIWEFLKTTQSTILKQTRKMGASLDWSREAFTLDDERVEAVKLMFVQMYEAGAIYRGKRIVNWCPRCHSTLADDEVEYKEEKAKLYWIKYGPFVLATARPETKLGDTAVAVHPSDERYRDMVGKEYDIPGVLGDFKIKVVADRAVDPEFGSGAIKVTPAHSFIDNQIAERHGVGMRQIIDENGKMMANCGKYQGMTTQEAREEIVKDMEKMGILDHVDEDYDHNIAACYRCATPIEPIPSLQWFVSVDKKLEHLGDKSLKECAMAAAKKGEIKFIPERFGKRYMHWMENLHDWCISRQIWFGHRIPVWYRRGSGIADRESEKSDEEIYVGIDPPEGKEWTQDEDTLDTWFSSGMWTFSTLGWPKTYQKEKKSGDLGEYHPTQILETGYEILTLWVSRMIMMSFFALGEIPFENVYLHGMVLDKHGKKMSKSKGNGIDPIEMIDKFGTDATRLSLLIGSTPGNDIRLFEEKIAGFRNFANKLWNVSRFILSNVESQMSNIELNEDNLTLSDKWILEKMNKLIKDVTEDIEGYRFSQAGERLREFTWNDLADWYLEVSKFEKNEEKNDVLTYVLTSLLKLWHPFIPFVTEAIWEKMDKEKFLMIEEWPETHNTQHITHNTNKFELVKEIIIVIRNARAFHKVEPGRKVKAVIIAGKQRELIESQAEIIKGLRTGISELEVEEEGDKIEKAIFASVQDIEIYLLGAVDEEKEKKRLKESIERTRKLIKMTEAKLGDKNFVERAPEPIVEKERARLKEFKEELGNLEGQAS